MFRDREDDNTYVIKTEDDSYKGGYSCQVTLFGVESRKSSSRTISAVESGLPFLSDPTSHVADTVVVTYFPAFLLSHTANTSLQFYF